MKKLLLGLGLSALMLGTTAMAAPASPPPIDDGKTNNGAIVINEDGLGSCSAQVWVPDYHFPLLLVGNNVHVVQNKNMINTICKLDIPEWIDIKRPIKVSGFECVLFPGGDGIELPWYPWLNPNGQVATGSNFIWTPGDQARLECFYKIPKEDNPPILTVPF